MVVVNEKDEHTEYDAMEAVFVENEKTRKHQESFERKNILEEDQDSDHEYLEFTTQDVNQKRKYIPEEDQDSDHEYLEFTSEDQDSDHAYVELTTQDVNQSRKNIPEEDRDPDHECLEFTTQDVNLIPAEINMEKGKALLEFRCRVEDAILNNNLREQNNTPPPRGSFQAKEQLREITLWGIPLLPSKGHQGTDVVLMKFLKANDFRVDDAFDMLEKTLKWRRENNIDGILDEDFGSSFGKAVYLKSRDKEGRPLCFNALGVFKDKQMYKKTFGTEEKCKKFLRWKIQLFERALRKLSFIPGEVDSMLEILDLKQTPKHGMKELRSVFKQTSILIQNYYPEIIHKIIVINAPFWLYTSKVISSRFMNQRSKNQFIFARTRRATQTLLQFITPECLPVEYGGLKRDNDDDFSHINEVSELKIKGYATSRVELPVNESGVTMIWDVAVVGWEVAYREEFVPDDEGSYTVLLENQKKMGDSIRNSFYINEPGKIVITIENESHRKRKIFYRSKAVPTVPMYTIFD